MAVGDHDLLIRLETTIKLQAAEFNRRLELLERRPSPNGNGRRLTPRDWLFVTIGGLIGGGGGLGIPQILGG